MHTNIHPARRGPEHPALRAMFAARKRVFIDLLKWDLPVLAGEFELDQFDDAHAQYLILTGEHGEHRASTRLLPTDRPHILGDLYPALCAGPVPTGPSIREITRFCLDPAYRAPERRRARNQLVTALVEHALGTGITDYTGVATRSWFDQIATFGWNCTRLGEPIRTGTQELVALHIRIDAKTPSALRFAGIYSPLTFRLAHMEEHHA
jgi:acyl homoserine lactone synthase/acyl-homoserine lactone synthase